ncbi:hypothetical protein K6L09_37845 [Burkholderia cepacia]
MNAWLTHVVSIEPQLTLVDRTNELQHGRVVAVTWESGKKSKLIFDQGVG